jgi:hypothetical protein
MCRQLNSIAAVNDVQRDHSATLESRNYFLAERQEIGETRNSTVGPRT